MFSFALYSGNELKKCFNFDLKLSNELARRTSTGKEFQSLGPAQEKDLSPYLVRVLGIHNVRSRRSLITNKTDKYGGARL